MKVNWFRDRGNIRQLVKFITFFCVLSLLLPGCGPEEATLTEEGVIEITLSSLSFQEGEQIPVKYTCDGQDISPPLAWGEPPAGIRSFALIMDDPDAPGGTFTHWVLFNIPSDTRKMPEAIPNQAELTSGALQGKNDFRKIGYNGPCPPAGPIHRYQLTIYALDKSLDLKGGTSKKQVLDAMQGHIRARGQLTGTYQR